jgi:hypothetical protein
VGLNLPIDIPEPSQTIATVKESGASCVLAGGERWFLSSGIIEPSGGVARYHMTDVGENARVSTEITAYTLSCLLNLYERLGNPEALAAALKAARFLCREAWWAELGVMPFEWPADGGTPEQATYFFDNGIIVRALLRAWKVTGEAEFLTIALGCGESMRRDFVNGRDIDPILDLPAKTPQARDGRWSRTSDCYQLKAALAWLGLAEATGDGAWGVEFDRVLERALRTHRRFVDAEPGPRTMDRLHAYGYFLEGLLARMGDAAARQALEEGLKLAGDRLRQWRGEFERSDVPAQILRVRLWSAAAGALKLDEERAAEEAAWAARYQTTGAVNVDGSFCFGSRNGGRMPFANPVSTAFCLQALVLYEDWRAGRELPPWTSLV